MPIPGYTVPNLHPTQERVLTTTTAPIRCPWSEGVSELYLEYHDQEWGVPFHDDRRQFEFLTLEGAQAGLSWSTVLNKRDGYRKAFANFDPLKVSRFSVKKIQTLVANPAIIRNKLKINSTDGAGGNFITYSWEQALTN